MQAVRLPAAAATSAAGAAGEGEVAEERPRRRVIILSAVGGPREKEDPSQEGAGAKSGDGQEFFDDTPAARAAVAAQHNLSWSPMDGVLTYSISKACRDVRPLPKSLQLRLYLQAITGSKECNRLIVLARRHAKIRFFHVDHRFAALCEKRKWNDKVLFAQKSFGGVGGCVLQKCRDD